MQKYVQTTFDLLSQFTGGRGGIDHGMVHFGIPAMFWAICLSYAWFRKRREDHPRERLLVWGFGFGLARELFMMLMVSLEAYGLILPEKLHVIFPPLEHAIFDIALVVIAAAFLRYLLNDRSLAKRYLQVGIAMVLLVYLATFWWWAGYITANPASKFGQTWCDWAFRINASLLLAYPIAVMMRRTSGWVRNVVVTALVFFFLNQFLKIPDMALGEIYEGYFAPIRHGLYHLAIPLLGYLYIREMYEKKEETERALALSEQNFRTLFDAANDGVLIHDFEGRFLAVNKRACDFLGYTYDELMSLPLGELDIPEMAEKVPERMDLLRKNGYAVFETAHFRKDKSILPVEVSTTIVEYEGRKTIFSVVRDITERKKNEEDLLQAKDRVIEEMERHNEYVHEVADRLRNPLQKLKGYLELLEEGRLSPEHKAFLVNIQESGRSIEEGIKKLT